MNGSHKARDVFNLEEIAARWAGGPAGELGEWCFENATAVRLQAYWLHSCQLEQRNKGVCECVGRLRLGALPPPPPSPPPPQPKRPQRPNVACSKAPGSD